MGIRINDWDPPSAALTKFLALQESAPGVLEPVQASVAEAQAALEFTKGPAYATRAALFADLDWVANTLGFVADDPTPAFNGIYRKNGASGTGSWTRIGDMTVDLDAVYDAITAEEARAIAAEGAEEARALAAEGAEEARAVAAETLVQTNLDTATERLEFTYQFSDVTSGTAPADGILKLNNATASAVTLIRVDYADRGGADRQAAIAGWLNFPAGTPQGRLKLTHAPAPQRWAEYLVTNVTDSTGYFTLAVTYVASKNMPFTDGVSVTARFRLSADRDVAAEIVARDAAILVETNARIADVNAEETARLTAQGFIEAAIGGLSAGLASEIVTRAAAVDAIPSLIPERPGDALHCWTQDLLGPYADTDALTSGVAVDTEGAVLRVSAPGIFASRQVFRIEPSRNYKLRAVVRRRTNTPDPAGDGVVLGIQWLTANQNASAGTSTVASIVDLTTASGRVEVSKVVARSAGDGIDIVCPTGAVYLRLTAQFYGTAPTTDLEVYAVEDVTDSEFVSPDLAAVEGRLDAIESETLPDRVEVLEAAAVGSEIAKFKTRAQALAAAFAGSVLASADFIETVAETDGGAMLPAVYERVVSEPDGGDYFPDDDGSFWAKMVPPSAIVEDFGSSVGLGNYTRDTEAFQAAMAAGIRVCGRAGVDFYYIAEGATPVDGSIPSDMRLKVKMGTDGFSHTIATGGFPTTYQPDRCVLHYLNAENIGWRNLEIFGDGLGARGNDYDVRGLAVSSGCHTTMLRGEGRLFLHDLPGVNNGAMLFNCIGSARRGTSGNKGPAYNIDTLQFERIGSSLSLADWGVANFVCSGFLVDQHADNLPDNLPSWWGVIDKIIGHDIRVKGAAYAATSGGSQQGDLMTLAFLISGGVRIANPGPVIGTVIGSRTGEVVDDCVGATIGEIIGTDIEHYVYKGIHGAKGARVGRVIATRCGIAPVILAGGASPNRDTEDNIVGPLTSHETGSFHMWMGTIVSATSTTAVLSADDGTSQHENDNFDQFHKGKCLLTADEKVTITNWNAATRTATVASWASGTPSPGTAAYIRRSIDTFGVLLTTGSGGVISKRNRVEVAEAEDTGDLEYQVYDNNTGFADNAATLHRDRGFQTQLVKVASANSKLKVYPGPALRSIVKLTIGSALTVTNTAAHFINFDTTLEDDYVDNAGVGRQASASEGGVRIICPGKKRSTGSLLVSGGVDGKYIGVSLIRDSGTLMGLLQFMLNGTGFQSIPLDFAWTHLPEWIGGSANLYRIQVAHESATSTEYQSVATNTWWSIMDG